MTTRKRVAARRPRAPSRKTKARRKRRLGAALNPARFLPTHQRYTAELLADVRRRFEETPEPIPSLAADLDVAPGSVHRIARRYDWVRRVPAPPRDVLPAMRILQEAAALEAGGVRADVAAAAADSAEFAADVNGEAAQCVEAITSAESFHETQSTPSNTPIAPSLSTIARLERAVLAELATIEAMRAAMGTLPQKPAGAARTVRTLSMLTQTLQHLQRLRASAVLAAPPAANQHERDHDDMPADIDEFRNELARRINAFVASRTESRDADRDAGVASVDAAQ